LDTGHHKLHCRKLEAKLQAPNKMSGLLTQTQFKSFLQHMQLKNVLIDIKFKIKTD